MTDLIPNDLSHLSDAEFNSLCPQGEHAPGREPLSPAANAIWEAFNQDRPGVFVDYGDCLAAALRAAADQVVPREPAKDPLWASDAYRQRADTRAYLLAIATELEATNDN